jgi:hypothetical protein
MVKRSRESYELDNNENEKKFVSLYTSCLDVALKEKEDPIGSMFLLCMYMYSILPNMKSNLNLFTLLSSDSWETKNNRVCVVYGNGNNGKSVFFDGINSVSQFKAEYFSNFNLRSKIPYQKKTFYDGMKSNGTKMLIVNEDGKGKISKKDLDHLEWFTSQKDSMVMFYICNNLPKELVGLFDVIHFDQNFTWNNDGKYDIRSILNKYKVFEWLPLCVETIKDFIQSYDSKTIGKMLETNKKFYTIV